MCTLPFLPLDDGGYLLGHNRDESRRRARGAPPESHRRGEIAFVAPRDPDEGGTWLGVNQAGITLCVLNAFEPDPSRLPEKSLSRGLVAWELLHLASVERIEERLQDPGAALDRVRAFQIVAAVPGWLAGGGEEAARAVRFAWDGRSLSTAVHEGPALFVSSGYDQEGAERERGRRWRSLLEETPRPGEEDLAAFLAGHQPRPCELSVCMHRGRARTVSRTLVRAGPDRIRIRYHDGPPCEAAPEHETELVPAPPPLP